MYANVFHATSFAQKANFTCACGWATSRLLGDGRTTRMVHMIRIISEDASQHCMCCRRVAFSRRLCVWAARNFTAIYSLRFALISTQSIIFTYASHGSRAEKKMFCAVCARKCVARACVCCVYGLGTAYAIFGMDLMYNSEMGKHTMISSFAVFGEWKLHRHRSTRLHTSAYVCSQRNERVPHQLERTNPWPSSAIICTDHSIYRRTYYFRSEWIMARITVVLRVYSHELCVECDHQNHRRRHRLLVLLCQKLRMCVPD